MHTVESILIANRGEIAVRIIRAARDLGIRTIAVYSELDRDAVHTAMADEAWNVGTAPAADSYLNSERILEIARESGATAIHPGYGFLAENAAFAQAVTDAGHIWIGPPPSAIKMMGDKIESRRFVAGEGYSLTPSVSEEDDPARFAERAAQIGFPLLIKASAGGGGKGMRLVRSAKEMGSALAQARGEASSAFGDDRVFLEKFVVRPRHIEFQILADTHGNCIHLLERECSIQRRHQKLIEEAPANRVSPELRAELGRAAVTAAKAVEYCGAGTCEFLVDGAGEFYFLEMNTRIQVEHAITEAVTGIDLVVAMIRIAAGEPLPFAQDDLEFRGHAIEARIYAEDPDNGFVPSPGEIIVYRPAGGIGIRVDSGVHHGATVTVHYDPMVAKLIAWGSDRAESIDRLKRALSEFVVKGIKTSIPFHQMVMRHPIFLEGKYDTGFIDDHMDGGKGGDELQAQNDPETRRVAFMLAAIAAYQRDKRRASKAAAAGSGSGPGDAWKDFAKRRAMRGTLS